MTGDGTHALKHPVEDAPGREKFNSYGTGHLNARSKSSGRSRATRNPLNYRRLEAVYPRSTVDRAIIRTLRVKGGGQVVIAFHAKAARAVRRRIDPTVDERCLRSFVANGSARDARV